MISTHVIINLNFKYFKIGKLESFWFVVYLYKVKCPVYNKQVFSQRRKNLHLKNDPIFGFLATMDGRPLQVHKLGNGQQYQR